MNSQEAVTETSALELLSRHGIDVSGWGQGEAKTLGHLLEELATGESRLEPRDGTLLRVIEGSAINVYFDDGRAVLELYEIEQVFTDGRRRVRDDLDAGLGEKMRPGESPRDAAHRALEEELGIGERLALRRHPQHPTQVKGPVPSKSFPGLTTLFMTHRFVLLMPSEHFRPEYVEEQPDKTTRFGWRRL